MNLPKFPHSAIFVGVTACGKTEFLLKLLETVYKNHLEIHRNSMSNYLR